jgi:(R,R)-butanediol dehydrogenase / meso-butanediol dehydrogenase / diacetyl reductase
MRSIEVASDRTLQLTTTADPVPGPRQVLIEVAHCGICGSDLHFRDVPELFPQGTVPGHELSGRIAALGEEVTGWPLHQRVTALPFAQCGECAYCRAGQEQVCPQAVPHGVGLGTGRAGGYADKVIVDERMLFALPDAVDDRAGTLVEPLAVALRAVDQARVPATEPVLVIGAGPIGLLTALVLHHNGYERAAILSRNPGRTAKARGLGLATTTAEHARDVSPVCVFDCAGTPSSAQLAVELLPPLGQVILVGLSLAPLDLPAPAIVLKELSIRGVIAYQRREFQQAIDLLATGSIPTDELITDTRPLGQAEDAFQELTTPGSDQLKIILTP